MVIKLEFCATRLRTPLGTHPSCPMPMLSLSELFADLLKDPHKSTESPC